MNLSRLAIKRPVFMTCVLILILVLGTFSFLKLPVDLFPDVTFPVVTVTTPYPGAGPKEVELLVSKPLEDELGTISGIKHIRSTNREGVSIVVAEFTLETDVKYAEQQVRDKVSSVKPKFPDDVKESTIRRIDPSDQPILYVALSGNLPMAKLYDLADLNIRPQLEQVNKVGLVEVFGGQKREVHIDLDRNKLRRANLSVSAVADRLASAGQNIPAGSVTRDQAGKDMVFRTVGEYENVQAIKDSAVNFYGNDVPLTVADLGTVKDSLEDPTSYAFWNGKPTLILYVYRQTGANTVQVAEGVKKKVMKIASELKGQYPDAHMEFKTVIDTARQIKLNVQDVQESILIGIFLTILVVYFFLGNIRSTLITGVAIPVSLIGAFALMNMSGFSINVMSLLAFSLAVGLLIDDAIVVRENIFRHMEMGKSARQAALDGTLEVTLAVIAVTATIIAVFGPIGFLSGVVGQFFKQFGLTVCFIMTISLFDALTNAPMMSAYFGGRLTQVQKGGLRYWLRTPVRLFDSMQTKLESSYFMFLHKLLRRPYLALIGTALVVLSSFYFLAKVPKTFLPTQDSGEFAVSLELPPGTSLEKMRDVAKQVDQTIRARKDVVNVIDVVGTDQGEKNKANFRVTLTPFGTRTESTSEVKAELRQTLKKFAFASPQVKDVDFVGGGMRPFTMNIIGQNLEQVQKVADQLMARLKNHPALLDVDSSWRPGKPEFQVHVDLDKAQKFGVTPAIVGRELRAQVEGLTPAVFRDNGEEYDVRVRLKPDQRDIQKSFKQTFVPNLNGRLVQLDRVAQGVSTTGPASVDREDRGRYIQISADIAPNGPGMGGAISDIQKWLSTDLVLPEGVSYRFVGQAENFQEMISSMLMAALMGLIFIYLVLSSLYESFLTPLTIMLVIPLAACGAFFALWVAGSSFDLFSMIGCIMLMGLATKNSIILVDYINHLKEQGLSEKRAILEAGRVRLRPILMTSFALIAGMIPIAIGLNEVSNQRRGLGVAVIGGVISSTFLTLIVIPCVYSYMEALKNWLGGRTARVVSEELVSTDVVARESEAGY